jgi:hypothetical protein
VLLRDQPLAQRDHRVLRGPGAAHAGGEHSEPGEQRPRRQQRPDATAPRRVRVPPARSARRLPQYTSYWPARTRLHGPGGRAQRRCSRRSRPGAPAPARAQRRSPPSLRAGRPRRPAKTMQIPPPAAIAEPAKTNGSFVWKWCHDGTAVLDSSTAVYGAIGPPNRNATRPPEMVGCPPVRAPARSAPRWLPAMCSSRRVNRPHPSRETNSRDKRSARRCARRAEHLCAVRMDQSMPSGPSSGTATCVPGASCPAPGRYGLSAECWRSVRGRLSGRPLAGGELPEPVLSGAAVVGADPAAPALLPGSTSV